MTTSTSTPASGTAGESHPFDYYHRPGMSLRPWPQRSTESRDLWEHPRLRYVEPMVPSCRRSSPGPLVELVADHQWQGDELMDDVVRAFRRTGMAQGRRMLDMALDHGIDAVPDAPAELVRLFDSLDNPPDWHDPVRWERGRQLWVNGSFASKMGMAVMDGLATFVGNDVSKATGATKRFINAFQRRMFESYTWFWNVTREHAMDRYSPIFKDTVKVRLMHAQVRVGLRLSWGDESFEFEGSPISCTSMLMGSISFGLVPMLIDIAHGRLYSASDLDDAWLHWAYIAYVFGVAPAVIPTTAVDAIELMNYFLPYTGGPTPETALMADSAAASVTNDRGKLSLLSRAAAGPLLGVAAYFGGEAATRALIATTPVHDVSLSRWIRLTGLYARANVWQNRVVDILPFKSARLRWRGRTGDRYWRFNLATSRISAKRKGITTTPYDHHDATPSTSAGCPIH
ncbi:oxygenase MpaB family protein [[Mycobacterium] nativiensis]|uniref:Oxygenase MpaB family protein n=1 Tax=[Mycobacterium] nativiensis TaxID=2855503 RepID=A0ABU5XV52_9MYCO|nr:oxygenase MpaB family protein [Mycolicibacter sp. MYC340]MEB3031818.1 oxygenase MpaB family protein [Mycolicibacter sp. MYC340]